MSDPVLRQPTLFTCSADARSRPALLARRCECGHVFHPPHPHGCERCGRGGSATEAIEIEARGVLTAVATVHVHPKLRTPFVLGRITLDAGPVVDAWFGAAPEAPGVGARVEGVLVAGATGEGGARILDCHFVPERRA